MYVHDEIVQKVRQEMPDEDVLFDLNELFKVFGDSTRIRILYCLFEMCIRDSNVGVYTGSLDALHSNMNYLRRSRQEYVLLCNSLIVFNANFTDMFKSCLLYTSS